MLCTSFGTDKLSDALRVVGIDESEYVNGGVELRAELWMMAFGCTASSTSLGILRGRGVLIPLLTSPISFLRNKF